MPAADFYLHKEKVSVCVYTCAKRGKREKEKVSQNINNWLRIYECSLWYSFNFFSRCEIFVLKSWEEKSFEEHRNKKNPQL